MRLVRITLGGGGTNLPSYYYRDYEGFLIAAAIDKYVYVTAINPFQPGIYLKYSEIEHVDRIDQVKHRIMREALTQFVDGKPQIEITTLADIPADTGLGSSGSFTTALLKALHEFNHKFIQPHELAELACHIEMDRLQEPIGKQDPYIAAYGGVTAFTFARDGQVMAKPVVLDDDTRHNLETCLLLFFTGISRSASSILKDQDQRTKNRSLDRRFLLCKSCGSTTSPIR